MRIGIDTGGTFTDLVLLDADKLRVHKVRSTPDDPSRAILAGLAEAKGRTRTADVAHGSTVATNAVLERQGARVALLATAGFEDVLRIGRQTRRELYNIHGAGPRPLVDPSLVFGIDERIAADGSVLQPIDVAQVDALIDTLRARAVESVAICFLHSYGNAAHEQGAAERLEQAGFTVSASHRVLPEYREFERWSTTVLNAYVTPLMSGYLSRLETQLTQSRLRIMQSNGGSISAGAAKARAVQTILSGPAAGVVGAQAVSRAVGYGRVITFDMGGTSTDVSLVDGAIGTTLESVVGDFPVRLPIIDIHTVGAGGGSIAYVDAGGGLRVGPRSAGADPGPACYGKGDEVTVTDANLLLNRLDAEYFLGGRMALDVDRARRAMRRLAERLNVPELKAAEGIVRVANANMERAIRVVSVQRGRDPRKFALTAFGGAGALHACDLAKSLEIRTIVVPRYAGVLSALGTLLADVTKDYSRTVLRRDHLTYEDLEGLFAPLEKQARKDLQAEGFRGTKVAIELAMDLRYIGQSYEITVPFRPEFRREFNRQHERLYGYASPQRPTEIVNLRLKAVGVTDKPLISRHVKPPSRPLSRTDVRKGWYEGAACQLAVYRWETLVPGNGTIGPAVIAGAQATAFVAPGFRFDVDASRNIVVKRLGAQPRL